MKPWSLAKAIMLPLKATAPIRAPVTPRTATLVEGSWTRRSSAAAMAAAAPPPMPLYTATICGMSVIWTRRAATQATMPPMPMAKVMRT